MKMYWEVVDIAWAELDQAINRPYMVNLNSLMVDESYQGLGFGTAILRAICRDADEEGIQLWLVAQSLSNDEDRLIRWYQSFGFEGPAGEGGYMIRQPKTPTLPAQFDVQ